MKVSAKEMWEFQEHKCFNNFIGNVCDCYEEIPQPSETEITEDALFCDNCNRLADIGKAFREWASK